MRAPAAGTGGAADAAGGRIRQGALRRGECGLFGKRPGENLQKPRGGEAVQARRQPVRPAPGAPPVPAPGAAEKVEWLYQGKNVEESQAPERAGAMRSKEEARCAQGCR